MRHKIKISDLMKRLNLPDHSTLEGIVVHMPETDKFLAFHGNTLGEGGYIWSEEPNLAFMFESQAEAEKFVKSYGKGSVVGLLFDLGDSYSLHVSD